ncbi:hypothetical protein LSH36_462g02112 [Paralvinella palmiformis]|uniref:Uncharacterized protein n=1 Tax=Paralvinella palmiformis TaxID=53620 RepID=A0AAD9JAJ8_9ANNE|nr:hypothetical protein LSH36_462g02112 [Paralvinella palmiformis]
MRSNYTKGNPSFCKRCIAKVTALSPELHMTKPTTDHAYHAEPPRKNRFSSTFNVVTRTQHCKCDKQMQTSAVIIDLDDFTTLDQLHKEHLEKLSFHLGKLFSKNLKI